MRMESLEAIAGALENAQVPYLLVGGLAVNAHGYGRLTFDVDIVIRLIPPAVEAAFAALASIDYHPAVPITAQQFGDAATREGFRKNKGMIVLKFWSDRHRETPIDVFVTEPFDFETEYAAALREPLPSGRTIPIIRYETLLRMKREAGRAQDLSDIRELEFLRTGSYDR